MSKLRKAAVRALPRKYKNKLRNAVHPAQRLALARMLTRGESGVGLLSVVIPAYNVAEYIAECLTSVISQSYTDLEIIVVDYGSTDASMQIVAGFAKYDKRISVIQLENGGNGRARNIGINVAKGEYLTFADSDDVVAPGAYALMMTAINESGSDFVVGSFARLMGKKIQGLKISSHMHAHVRLGITIDDFPDILDDDLLGNKLFKKTFWDARVTPIPEGVLFEQQEATARAFVRACRFDVLEEVVYLWRQRNKGVPAAQGEQARIDLEDRLKMALNVTKLVASESTEVVLEKWFVALLGHDLIPYYVQVTYGDDVYWSVLRAGVESIHALFVEYITAVGRLMTLLDPHARVLLRLALDGMKKELEQVVVDHMEIGTGFQVEVIDGHFYAVPNYAGLFPEYTKPELLECDPSLLQIETKIDVRGHTNTDDVLISGHGFLRGYSDTFFDVHVDVEEAANVWRPLAVQGVVDDGVNATANDSFASHRNSSFTATVPASSILSTDYGLLRFRISLSVGGQTFSEIRSIGMPDSGTRKSKSRPHVSEFIATKQTEEFSIDVHWGDDSPAQNVHLATQQHRIDPVKTTDLGQNKMRYFFKLSQINWGREVYAPASGAYTLRYHGNAAPTTTSLVKTLQASDTLSWKLPLAYNLNHSHLQAWTTTAGNFAVTIGPPLLPDERGKYWQRTLQQRFTANRETLCDHVVLESFGGKACTDSPRAISDELHLRYPDLPIYWSITDYSVSYPEYATPLIRGTAEWTNKMQSAKALVNNNNFPFYFRKSPGQYYLQTWHGTPLKKIGVDAPHGYISPSYRYLMERESGYWDALLVQNEFSKEVLPKALGFHGEVICRGYPRNDALTATGFSQRRDLVRASLGLAKNQIAVLYAPTWRDDAKKRGGGHDWIGHLDTYQALAALGANYTFLVRAHHNTSKNTTAHHNEQVIDVSSYPEINDLILAADVLVTDYSSILFDFLITGKPIFYLAADLEHYSNTIRGFYLDYDRITDTRLYEDTDGLVDALMQYESSGDPLLLAQLGTEFTPFGHNAVSGSIAIKIAESIY